MNLFSAEDKELKKHDIFVDLDQLGSRVTDFLLHGEPRIIRPVRLIDQLKIANAMARLIALVKKEKITSEELFEAYFELFEQTCEPFTREDLEKMNHRQCGALYQAIEDHLTGRFHLEKKKT